MNTTMSGKDFLDALASGATGLFANGLEHLFGTGVRSPVFGSVTWADLGATLCWLLVVLLVNGLAVAFLRHKSQRSAIAKNAHDYNGMVPEKYNVVTGSHDVFVEYGNVGTKFSYIATEGFGWMNASFEVGLKFLSPARLADLRDMKPPPAK